RLTPKSTEELVLATRFVDASALRLDALLAFPDGGVQTPAPLGDVSPEAIQRRQLLGVHDGAGEQRLLFRQLRIETPLCREECLTLAEQGLQPRLLQFQL